MKTANGDGELVAEKRPKWRIEMDRATRRLPHWARVGLGITTIVVVLEKIVKG